MSSILQPGKRYYAPGQSGQLPSLSLEEIQSFWRAAPGVAADEGTVGATRVDTGDSLANPMPPWISDVVDYPYPLARAADDYAFFLTADSAAPEETFASTPRVSMWPTSEATPPNGSIDEAMASTAQLGTSRPYSFERRTANDLHFLNVQIGSSQNERLLQNYLRPLSSIRIPSTGKSLSDGLGGISVESDLSEWLSLACDQIVSTNYSGHSSDHQAGAGMVVPWCQCGGEQPHVQRWSRSPFPLKGIGRIPTVTEVALVLYCTAYRGSDGVGEGEDWESLPIGTRRVNLAFVVEATCPRHGVNSIIPDVAITIGERSFGSQIETNSPRIVIDGTRFETGSGSGIEFASPDSSNSISEQDWAGGGMGLRLLSALGSDSPQEGMMQTADGSSSLVIPFAQDKVQVSIDSGIDLVVFSTGHPSVDSAMQRFPLRFRPTLPCQSLSSSPRRVGRNDSSSLKRIQRH